MNPIQIILLFIFAFLVIYWFSTKLDIFSPAKVFSTIWIVAIILTLFKFSGYQFTWSTYSWIILLVGLLSFLLGNFIVFVINSDKKYYKTSEIREIFSSGDILDIVKLNVAIKVLFALYFLAFIIEAFAFGTIPILSHRPDFARTRFGFFGLHLLVNLIPVILFLCIEYLVVNTKSKKRKLDVTIIFIITTLSYFSLLERFNYFFAFTMSLGVLYYSTKLMNFKRIFVISVIFITMVWILQNIRLSQYAEQFIYITSKMKYSSEYAVFTGPYMYIVMNLENMAKGVDILNQHSFGILTGDWVLALTGLKHWIQEYFNIDYRRFVYSGYNTYPFLWSYFYDFGIIGVALLSLILGFIISTVYYSLKLTPSVKWLNLYAFFLFVIIISFFTNALSSLNVIFNLIVLWLVSSFITNKKIKLITVKFLKS